jgi:hypothetical protein
VGKKANYDYSVTFNDSQELQQSRQRLLKALSAVESSIESSLGIQAHLDNIAGPDIDLGKQCTHIQLELFQSRMRGHQRGLMRLLDVSTGTSNLV